MSSFQTKSTYDPHCGTIETGSKKIVDLRNPCVIDISIIDIAAALSKICRFGGHIPQFYSVAQHSVLVAAMACPELKGQALLHDAAEAYLGDVVKPLKVILGKSYKDLEDRFEDVISDRFYRVYSRTEGAKKEIKKLDLLAYEIEDEAFRRGDERRLRYFHEKYELLSSCEQIGWPPVIGQTIFMNTYNQL